MAGSVLEIEDLKLNVPQREVTRAGIPIALSPREFDLLQVLMQEPGRTFARSELSQRVWQGECDNESRTVDMHVRNILGKLHLARREELIRFAVEHGLD